MRLLLFAIAGLSFMRLLHAQTQNCQLLPITSSNSTSIPQRLLSPTSACWYFVSKNETNDGFSIRLSVSMGAVNAFVRLGTKVVQLLAYSGTTDWRVIRSNNMFHQPGQMYNITVNPIASGTNQYTLEVFYEAESNITTDKTTSALFKDLKSRCCSASECLKSWGESDDPCMLDGSACSPDPENKTKLLKRLFLTGLSCELPLDIISELKHLERLELVQNDFSTTRQVNWTALASMANLTFLGLSNDGLNGPISCDLSRSSLKYLDLKDNNFSGDLPSCLFRNKDLSVIRLNNNILLSGRLNDSDFSSDSQLQWIGLANVSLSGDMPKSLAVLPYLYALLLPNTGVSGGIPNFGQPTLQHLDLSNNKLTGPIPSSLVQAKGLNSLSLDFNSLNAPFPADIAKLQYLTQFSCEGCGLTGALPEDWGQAESLRSLNLPKNQLTGTISPSLFNLPSLFLLDLSSNRLSGPLPDALSTSGLYDIDLHSNSLSGPIPSSFSQLPTFTKVLLITKDRQTNLLQPFLDLSNNTLQGEVPNFIMSAGSLRTRPLIHLEGNPGLTCTDGTPWDESRCSEALRRDQSSDSTTKGSSRGGISKGALVAVLVIVAIICSAILAAGIFVLVRVLHKRGYGLGGMTSFKRFRQSEAASEA